MSRLPECLSDPINFIKSSNQPWPLDFWLDTNLTIKNAPYIGHISLVTLNTH